MSSPVVIADAFDDSVLRSVQMQRHATPLLVMSRSELCRCVDTFKAAFPGVLPHFAVKCNPNAGVLRCLSDLDVSFEIASAAEARLLRSIGVSSTRIIFSNPVRARSEIESAWRLGITRFAVDCVPEVEKVASAAPKSSVYVRLAPGTSDQGLVGSEGKYGVDPEDVYDILSAAQLHGLATLGISVHVGSQLSNPHSWRSAFQRIATTAELALDQGFSLSMVNMGGGFPVDYGGGALALSEIGRFASQELAPIVDRGMQIWAEPGRAFVATAGVMLCEVTQVTRRRGVRWIHTDLGAFNGMMEVLESDGQLQYPMHVLDRTGATERFQITGPTCDSKDTFGFGVEIPDSIEEGDLIAVRCSGAYTAGYASEFNGFRRPDVIMVD